MGLSALVRSWYSRMASRDGRLGIVPRLTEGQLRQGGWELESLKANCARVDKIGMIIEAEQSVTSMVARFGQLRQMLRVVSTILRFR